MKSLYVDNTPYPGHHTGTSQGGGNDPPTITLSASCAEPDDAYVQWGLRIVSGTGAGQSRRITDYIAASRVAEVEFAWETPPDSTSVYEITFGCDTNAGMFPWQGSNGPFATVDRSLEEAEAGDTVWVRAGTPYVRGGTATARARIRTCGTVSLPIRLIGYRQTPGDAEGHWGDDAYRAQIDAAGALAHAIEVDGGLSGATFFGWEFAHLRFVDATGSGVAIGAGQSGMAFVDCAAADNGGTGFDLGALAVVAGCEASGNGGCGVCVGAGSHVDGCRVHDNGDDGIRGSGRVENTVVYGIADGKRGIYLEGGSADADAVRQCVVDGTRVTGSATGISLAGRCSLLIGTIVCGCGVGVSGPGSTSIAVARNNLYHGNTTDRQDWPADRTGGVSGDPRFEDGAGHDYRLRSDSPGAAAGWPASLDLGASQRRPVVACSPTHVGMQT